MSQHLSPLFLYAPVTPARNPSVSAGPLTVLVPLPLLRETVMAGRPWVPFQRESHFRGITTRDFLGSGSHLESSRLGIAQGRWKKKEKDTVSCLRSTFTFMTWLAPCMWRPVRSSGQVFSCPLVRDEAQGAERLRRGLWSLLEGMAEPGLQEALATCDCCRWVPTAWSPSLSGSLCEPPPGSLITPGVWNPDSEPRLLSLILVVTASRTGILALTGPA